MSISKGINDVHSGGSNNSGLTPAWPGPSSRLIRTCIFLAACALPLQITLLLSLTTLSKKSLRSDKIIFDQPILSLMEEGNEYSILQKTVELLFMGNQTSAREYLDENNSLSNLLFYVHDNLPEGIRSVEDVSVCLLNYGYNGEKNLYPTKEDFISTFCDYSQSICNPSNYTRASQYSTTRLNNNLDSVIVRLLSSHMGRYRTYNQSHALIKVVPFVAMSNDRCHKGKTKDHVSRSVVAKWNNYSKQHDHLFFGMYDESFLSVDRLYSGQPGQIVMPYANTNREYQPNTVISSMSPSSIQQFYKSKKYILSAVFSKKISGNGYQRANFVEKADAWFGNGTIEHGNGTLAGMPVKIVVIQEKRKMPGESATMQLYRDSIFCPIFRGDTPDQKRIFDAILSGCIPVVYAHYFSVDGNIETSYFARGAARVHQTLPWALGSFGGYPNMGIDYSKLVVEVDETNCGLDCMPTVLEQFFQDKSALREKQLTLAKYACLYSYGLEEYAFKYVDAMLALLIRARHYIMHEVPTS